MFHFRMDKSGKLSKNKKNPGKFDFRAKCKLCGYETTWKNLFQKHLMFFHGQRLETEGYGDHEDCYGLTGKFTEEPPQFDCPKCRKLFKNQFLLNQHVAKQCKVTKLGARKSKAKFTCDTCGVKVTRKPILERHKTHCGKKKDVCCQLCAFTCYGLRNIRKHVLLRHNLDVKWVQEPDFMQALNGTPYRLERINFKNAVPNESVMKRIVKKKKKSRIEGEVILVE